MCLSRGPHRRCWNERSQLAGGQQGPTVGSLLSRRNAAMDQLSSHLGSRLGSLAEKLRGSTKAKYGDKPGWNPKRDESPPLVAMDFTGSRGRIIDNPREARAVAAAEFRGWKRKLPRSTSACGPYSSAVAGAPQHAQPWFHGSLQRETATLLLLKHATEDGAFLVRRSLSRLDTFVLSYLFHGEVRHVQIETLGEDCFSIDSGRTKFSCLQQLVQFYQLNQGNLLTRLGQCLKSEKPKEFV
ncbi:growth factor receptor-bound protein 14-like [Ixodes scapularis]